MEIERDLKIAINTGKVLFGRKEAEKAVKEGRAKCLIMANNCPSNFLKNHSSIKTLSFPGDNIALGAICGKPFSISVVTVIDPGDSNLLSR